MDMKHKLFTTFRRLLCWSQETLLHRNDAKPGSYHLRCVAGPAKVAGEGWMDGWMEDGGNSGNFGCRETKSPDLDLMLKSKECCVSREAREHYKDTLPIHLNFCCELSVNLCKIMVSCQPESTNLKTQKMSKAIAEVKANLSLSST